MTRSLAAGPLIGVEEVVIGRGDAAEQQPLGDHHPDGQRQHDGEDADDDPGVERSEEHTSELQSLMRISYAVFCLKKKKKNKQKSIKTIIHNHNIQLQ